MSAYCQPRRGRRKKKLIKPLVPASQSPPLTLSPPASSPTSPVTPATNPIPAHPEPPRFRSTSLKELGKDRTLNQTPLLTSQTKEASNRFSQDDLVKYWIEYAESLTIEKVHLKNTLISCKPALKENFSFEVAVFNPSQKEEISDSRALIIGYLSNKLNNNRLVMDIRLVEKDEVERVYTLTEKYDYLSKKNPVIEKLMGMFHLTMD